MSMNPPDYEQSEKIRKSVSYNDQSGRASQHPSQDTPPTYNRNQPEPVIAALSHPQASILGKGGIPSREETEEEKKERKRQQLERRKVPLESWEYYLESPELWDFTDVNEDGLQKGVYAVLIAPHSVVPCWVRGSP